MGQTAMLVSLTKSSFDQLAADPASFDYHQVALASEGFNKTFEGLRFVLSKAKPEEADLLAHLFEPSLFVGEEIDYAEIDWDNLPADMPLEGTAVYYHDPATVQALSAQLVTVTDQDFRQAFDPDELNRSGIYPEVWNRKEGENQAFNERHLLRELHHLQHFMATTSAGNHYCVCYID
jgi:hypothetical protein